MNRGEFSSYDLKRCILKVGDICTGACFDCKHKEAIRDELIARHMSPGDLLAMDQIPPEMQQIFRSTCAKVGETVEHGVGGCDHTDLRRNMPLTREQLLSLDDID
ncbi:hypothetical protein KA057_02410 [Candidatus Gracilibacteria bacterium]|nr:hypothetical protein [Candidatus Gracilibacteria bacterium]